jgi:hypothetical protein
MDQSMINKLLFAAVIVLIVLISFTVGYCIGAKHEGLAPGEYRDGKVWTSLEVGVERGSGLTATTQFSQNPAHIPSQIVV